MAWLGLAIHFMLSGLLCLHCLRQQLQHSTEPSHACLGIWTLMLHSHFDMHPPNIYIPFTFQPLEYALHALWSGRKSWWKCGVVHTMKVILPAKSNQSESHIATRWLHGTVKHDVCIHFSGELLQVCWTLPQRYTSLRRYIPSSIVLSTRHHFTIIPSFSLPICLPKPHSLTLKCHLCSFLHVSLPFVLNLWCRMHCCRVICSQCMSFITLYCQIFLFHVTSQYILAFSM